MPQRIHRLKFPLLLTFSSKSEATEAGKDPRQDQRIIGRGGPLVVGHFSATQQHYPFTYVYLHLLQCCFSAKTLNEMFEGSMCLSIVE